MPLAEAFDLDLTPPAFHEGLEDWSRGDGTPDSPTYEAAPHARLIATDPDFGDCLEMRKIEATQRLRYMGEVPARRGAYLEISAPLKLVRGPAPSARIAAWPGGARARRVTGLPEAGPLVRPRAGGAICSLRVVIGPEARAGVDLVWDARVLYAHVGLDLTGATGGVVRIARIVVRDVSGDFTARAALPGFEAADPVGRGPGS